MEAAAAAFVKAVGDLSSVKASSLHTARRKLYNATTTMTVCTHQPAVETAVFELLASPHKVMCTPLQVAVGDLLAGLFEWGDARRLPEALPTLLKLLSRRGGELGARVAVTYVLGELFVSHGPSLEKDAMVVITALAKLCKASDSSLRAAAVIAIQRLVEGVGDGDNGVKTHAIVAKVVDKCVVDKMPFVRSAVGGLVQAVATASRGLTTVKLHAVVKVCAKALVDPNTQVRTAFALALASVLANSVVATRGARAAAARAADASRLDRLRNADIDDGAPSGEAGAGGPASGPSRPDAAGDAPGSASRISRIRNRLSGRPSVMASFTLVAVFRYFVRLMRRCDDGAARAAASVRASSGMVAGGGAGGGAPPLGGDDGLGGSELPPGFSVAPASFRASVGTAVAAFVRTVRDKLGDRELATVVKYVLAFVAKGTGASSPAAAQRRAVVTHILRTGLSDAPPHLGDRYPSVWQQWQRLLLTALADVLRTAVDAGGSPSDVASVSDDEAGGGAPEGPPAEDHDDLRAAVSPCGIVCVLNELAYVLVQQGDVAAPLVDALVVPVTQCLSHSAHAVRLAAAACLRAVACLQPGGPVARLQACLGALSHAHSAVTSPAAVAATAAAAAAAAAAASKAPSRKEKLKARLRLGGSHGGKAALAPHVAPGGLGIPGCGEAGGLGVCGKEDQGTLATLHGFSVAVAALVAATARTGCGVPAATGAAVFELASGLIASSQAAPAPSMGGSLAAQAASAAAAEVDAACGRAGWALLQALCCTGLPWVQAHWDALTRALADGLRPVAGGGPVEGPYAGVAAAWHWVTAASAMTTLTCVARVVGPAVVESTAAAKALMVLLTAGLDATLAPGASPFLLAGLDVGADAGRSGVAFATGGRKSSASTPTGLSSVAPGDRAAAEVLTVAQAAGLVGRRCVVHSMACVLEAANALPVATAPFAPLHTRLLSAAQVVLSGGVLSVNTPALACLVTGGRQSGGMAAGSLLAPDTLVASAAFAGTCIPEPSFPVLNRYAVDAVLTRGMGESSDPNVPPSVRRMLSSRVLSALDADWAAAWGLWCPPLAGSDAPAVPVDASSATPASLAAVATPLAPGSPLGALFPHAGGHAGAAPPAWTTSSCVASVRAADAAVGIVATVTPFLPEAQAEAVVGILTAPLRPQSATDSRLLSPASGVVQGLADALQHRLSVKERCLINRNAAGAALAVLANLEPGDVRDPARGALCGWLLKVRAVMGAGLVSVDNVVRRACGQALAELARLGGPSFARKLVASIQKQADTASAGAEAAAKLGTSGLAGAVFALGALRRVGRITRGAVAVDNIHDTVVFEAARETKQPVRTWALHTWWLLVDSSGADFGRYVQPSLSLLDAHILSTMHYNTYVPASMASSTDPSAGSLTARLVRGGGVVLPAAPPGAASSTHPRLADDFMSHVGADPYLGGRLAAMEASVALCLARILLSVVEGLGPELSRRPEVATKCVAAWAHLAACPDAAVTRVCLATVRLLVVVAPELLPRPLVLALFRTTLLGPSVVHPSPEAALKLHASGNDAVLGGFLVGLRRLGVRFASEASGRGPAAVGAVLGGAGTHGRSFVGDLLAGCIASHTVACCSFATELLAGEADFYGDGGHAVWAGPNRFAGTGAPLGVLPAVGSCALAAWQHHALAVYTNVFHLEPGTVAAAGVWGDLWLNVDDALSTASDLWVRAPPVTAVLSGMTRVGCDLSLAAPDEAAVHALGDDVAAVPSVSTTQGLVGDPSPPALQALLQVVEGTHAPGPEAVSVGALDWLDTCASLLTGTGGKGGGKPGGGGSDAGSDAGDGTSEDGTSEGASAAGGSGSVSGASLRDSSFDGDEETGFGVGLPSMWSDVRWQARSVAVGVVRWLLASWAARHGGQAFPRAFLPQLTSLLSVSYLAAASSEDDPGVATLQAAGLALLQDVLDVFAGVEDPDVVSVPVLQQHQAQISACVRPFLQPGAPPGLRQRACRLVSTMVLGGVAADKVAVKRLVHCVVPVEDGSAAPGAAWPGGHTLEYREAADSGVAAGVWVSQVVECGRLWAACGSDSALAAGAVAGIKAVLEPQLGALLTAWAEVALQGGANSLPCASAVANLPASPPGGGLAALDAVWAAATCGLATGGGHPQVLVAVLQCAHLPALKAPASRLVASLEALAPHAEAVWGALPLVLRTVTAGRRDAPWLVDALAAAPPHVPAQYLAALASVVAPVLATSTSPSPAAASGALPAGTPAVAVQPGGGRDVAVAVAALARGVRVVSDAGVVPLDVVAVVRGLLVAAHNLVFSGGGDQVVAAAGALADACCALLEPFREEAALVATCAADAVAALRGSGSAARASKHAWRYLMQVCRGGGDAAAASCREAFCAGVTSRDTPCAAAALAAVCEGLTAHPGEGFAAELAAAVLPPCVGMLDALGGAPQDAAAVAGVGFLSALFDSRPSGEALVPIVVDACGVCLGAGFAPATRQAAAQCCMKAAGAAAAVFKAHVAGLEESRRVVLQTGLRSALSAGGGGGPASGQAAAQPSRLTLDSSRFKK